MRHLFLILLFFAWSVQTALAYGPNVVDSEGDVVRWGLPVIIDVDADLTKNCSDSSTKSFLNYVNDAIAEWESPTETALRSTIRTLPEGVDSSNACSYLYEAAACPSGPTNGPSASGYNPIVFDEDGGVTARFFGAGNKYTTLGFAGIITSDLPTDTAGKGEGVINVACIEGCAESGCPTTFSLTDVRAFITHELGHFLGLNHTQVNLDNDISSSADRTFTPTMWALFSSGAGADIKELNRDDEVGIAYLYPSSTLSSGFCTVSGTIVDGNASEFQCANVIARNTSTTSSSNYLDAMSFVSGSDMLGATSSAGRGNFTIKGLTPGNTYQIEVEPVSKSGRLSAAASGIIPCNGGSNPTAPTFDERTLSATVTCSSSGSGLSLPAGDERQTLAVTAGSTISVGSITLTNASGNVASGVTGTTDDDDSGSGDTSSSSGGCNLVRY